MELGLRNFDRSDSAPAVGVGAVPVGRGVGSESLMFGVLPAGNALPARGANRARVWIEDKNVLASLSGPIHSSRPRRNHGGDACNEGNARRKVAQQFPPRAEMSAFDHDQTAVPDTIRAQFLEDSRDR